MRNFDKKIVVAASFLAGITIAIGAFGAHGLKEIVSPEAVQSFETGVRYQMYHAFALLVIGLANVVPQKIRNSVFWLFIGGVICFSGSIYLLSLKGILPFNPASIAFVTPFGGLLFIIGWFRLAFGMLALK